MDREELEQYEYGRYDIAGANGDQGDEWRARTMIVGGVLGAVLGVLSAWLYIRSAEEKYGGRTPPSPGATEAVGLGVTLLGIVRSIAEMGKR